VTVDAPGMAIAWDAEVVGLERGGVQTTMRVVPWSTAAFTYTPQPLPTEPADPGFEPLDLGDAALLTATYGTGRVTVAVVPASGTILRPRAVGRGNTWGTVVGAADAVAAVAEAVADDDTSFVATPSRGLAAVYRLTPCTVAGPIVGVRVTARARKLGGGWSVLSPYLSRSEAPDYAAGGAWPELTTSYVTMEYTWPTLPTQWSGWYTQWAAQRGAPWTASLVDALAFGVTLSPLAEHTEARLTQLYATVLVRRDVLREGFVRYYRASNTGGGAPAAPAEADYRLVAEDYGPQVDDVAGAWPGQSYWYWARVYDAQNRMVRLLGPVLVAVT
jgi:hypothetical protein